MFTKIRITAFSSFCSLIVFVNQGSAHEWHRHANQQTSAKSNGTQLTAASAAEESKEASATEKAPANAAHFQHFKNVQIRWDKDLLYVDSNGLPDHGMMVGIKAWQQQVPLPQPFTGQNAWKLPLHPRLALNPINAKETSFRGAIAVAVNGVPIFSALNNRGVDAYLAGELDYWGGHCGRGDDYHYHIAPIHLEEVVGKGNPIAFALDGFPIYGMTEADGSPVGKLDALNGQFDLDGNYHYHATKTYPYINGGVRGVVDFRDGAIASQPKDSPIRPGQQPLRGATITDFETSDKQSVLTYEVAGRKGTITYAPASTNSYRFTYSRPGGQTWTETYQRRSRNDQDRQRKPPPRRREPRR